MALSNPCVQYKSTKFGFGSHFEKPAASSGILGSNQSLRMFSEGGSERPYKVHPRGYNDFSDIHYIMFHEVNGAMLACHNCADYAHIFVNYSDHLTDFQIAYAFFDICNHNYPKTPEFWDIILPRVKEQIPYLDRNCVQAMMQTINGAGAMQLQDNELWEALESKLVDEGLLRYFNLDQMSEILLSFAGCGRGSDDLIDALEKNFIKHRKALIRMPQTVEKCKVGFGQLSKGSEILKRVLEDPSTDLPQLE